MMRNHLITCLVVCLCLQLVGSRDAWSQPPQSSPRKQDQAKLQAAATDALIEHLGSKRFAVREHATEQLILLGLPAIPHLERASRSEDREVRQRSQLVLSVVRELDFLHRLKSFEQDADGDKSYGLPGWERFRDLTGNTTASRTLFSQMQKAERELLGAESQAVEDAGQILKGRCLRLRLSIQMFRTRHELPPIAAALFVATNPEIPIDISTNSSLLSLCEQLSFESGMNSNVHRSILRNLLAAWILREDAMPARKLLKMALQYNIAQSLPRARMVAKQPEDFDAYDLRSAIMCLAKFGGIDDVARLEAIMADKRVISEYTHENITYIVEVRDLVLAALLKLTESEPSAFGYRRLRFQEPFVFDTLTLGFDRDQFRQVALAKWRMQQIRPETR